MVGRGGGAVVGTGAIVPKGHDGGAVGARVPSGRV